MKMMAVVTLALLAGFALPGAQASNTDPIQKVLQMIGDLQTKIIGEGKECQKVYDEFAEFCEDRSRELGFEIKTGKAGVKDLEAAIEKEKAKQSSLTTQIEEISAAIATDEADLDAATKIREKEQAAFQAEEKELVDVIDTLERAIGILEKELSKSGASMMQLKSANSVAQALSVMVEATSLSSADASKLTALLQNSQDAEDESDATGAPAAAVYKGKSGGIIETMQDLYDKAEGQLAAARDTEAKALQAYQMLAQGLKDEITYANKDLDKSKKANSASAEAQATAEGDLSVTSKDLAEDIKDLAALHQECMSGAEDFEAETKSRGEELKALTVAKKIIVEATSGAAEQSYSFIQVSVSSGADLANFEAVRFVRDLAQKQKSASLSQLAIRMAAAMRGSHGNGADVFAKIKGLIQDMIEKLVKEAQEDATEKAYCDKEMAETEQKKSDKEGDIEKLTTQIDSQTARSNKLKEEVATLQKELSELTAAQAEMDKVRAEEKGLFDKNSAEMEKGIKGIKLALKVLRDYYAKGDATASSGAGSGIIGLLEVAEADFTKGLAEMVSAERMAVNEYDATSKENEITKLTKEQDVKYKTKEFKGLDKATAEATADRSGVQEELDAVNSYYASIKERCVAKAEPYAERKARREEEIAGLKNALTILDGQAVLLQRTAKHGLRGAQIRAHA